MDAIGSGRFRVVRRVSGDDGWYVEVEPGAPRRALTRQERLIVERVARGAAHGEIGYELGIAISTVSTHLGSALRKLGLRRTDLPLLDGVVRARGPGPGGRYRLVSPPVDLAALPELTPSELEVTRLVVWGGQNGAIAATRRSSRHTVANQLADIFRKLRVQSRLDLARCVAERASSR